VGTNYGNASEIEKGLTSIACKALISLVGARGFEPHRHPIFSNKINDLEKHSVTGDRRQRNSFTRAMDRPGSASFSQSTNTRDRPLLNSSATPNQSAASLVDFEK
jgi:hypothetical protein